MNYWCSDNKMRLMLLLNVELVIGADYSDLALPEKAEMVTFINCHYHSYNVLY